MDPINSDIYQDIGLRTNPAVTANERLNDVNDLGVAEFMELMIAQIQNQDPFNPTDNGDFISQLAQFGTLSGVESLNTSFGDFSNSVLSDQAINAASLVGRHVQVPGNVAQLTEEGLSGVVDVPAAASNVRLEVVTAAGELVKTLELSADTSGYVPFAWDGIGNNGQAWPAGNYLVTAEATVAGETESIDTMVDLKVDSVTLGEAGGGVILNLSNGISADFEKVFQIK